MHQYTIQSQLDEIADEFSARLRRGEQPVVCEYTGRYPQHAEEISELLSSVTLIESLKPKPETTRNRLPAELNIGRLDDYRIVREVGRGGMGVVFEAEHEALGRRVAIKVLPSRAVLDAKYLSRFRFEAQAAARLHHPNIVPVFGVGECDGNHYYVMEFISGSGLSEVISDYGYAEKSLSITDVETNRPVSDDTLSPLASKKTAEVPPSDQDDFSRRQLSCSKRFRFAAEVGIKVAQALDYAHSQGTLHRDIKPSNILIDEDDSVWVTDFGLAKCQNGTVTNTGEILGTPQYMPPESWEGQTDHRSDVYSLGLSLYELVTLRPAFQAPTTIELLRKIGESEITSPQRIDRRIPRDLATILMKASARLPEHRYQSAAELEEDLQCFLADRPIHARRVLPWERAWRWSRRNPVVAGLSAATIGLLLAVAITFTVGSLRTREALVSVEKERVRAQTNLDLALHSLNEVMDNITARGGTRPLTVGLADGQIAGPDITLTDADVKLLEKVLSFYDRFAQENEADLRFESARAWCKVGEIQTQLGRVQDAQQSYGKAVKVHTELLAIDPSDHGLIMEQARTLASLGKIEVQRGDMTSAMRYWAEATELLDTSPDLMDSPAGRLELVKTLNCYGLVGPSFVFGSLDRSEREFGTRIRRHRRHFGVPGHRPPPAHVRLRKVANDRALRLLSQLQESTDKDSDAALVRLELAKAHRNRSDLAKMEGDWDEYTTRYEELLGNLEKSTIDYPESAELRYEFALALCTDGENLKHIERASKLADDLVAANPHVPEYQVLKATTLCRFAATQMQWRDLEGASQTCHDALAYQRKLRDRFPTVLLYRLTLVRTLQRLAEIEFKQRDDESAISHLQEADAALDPKSIRAPRYHMLRPMIDRIRRRLAMIVD